MSIIEFIKIMIKIIKKNYSSIFENQDLEKYIDRIISFIDKDEQFRNLINSSNLDDVEKLGTLSKDLSIIKEKLKHFCKLNHIEDTQILNVCAYIILNCKPSIFDNRQLLSDFNKEIGKEFFISHFNYGKFVKDYSNLIDTFDISKNDVKKMDAKTIAFRIHRIVFEVTDLKKLKIIVNILNILSNIYKENDFSTIERIFEINNLTIKLDKIVRKNKLPSIDFFNVLYNYKEMLKNKFIDDNSKQKIFSELFDRNSCFNELYPYEITLLIYYYFFLYETSSNILSEKEDFVFKDLSPIVNFIRWENKKGIDSAKIINDLASGKIKLNLKEKKEKNIKK